MKEAYRTQRGNAKDRGIDFNFTYEDWCLWWEEQLGTHWRAMRGCRRNHYVMARFNDLGAYERGNVEAVLSQDNIKIYNMRRKPVFGDGKRFQHLPKGTVAAIYLDKSRYAVIAAKYGVTKHKIQCIKQKHYYRKITDALDELR